jgi:cell division protein FtsW
MLKSIQNLKHHFQTFLLTKQSKPTPQLLYDQTLLWVIFSLMGLGLIMVTSASVVEVAQQLDHNPLHFFKRHFIYLGLCAVVSVVVLQIPTRYWQLWSPALLVITICLLMLVLFVGKTVNGSTRWLGIGSVQLQVAELAKLAFTLFISGYLVRRYGEVRAHAKGFYKPITLLILLSCLLLLQPDLGSSVVLFVITVSLLFLAGAKIRDFLILVFGGLGLIACLAIFSPYRLKRITAFLDPWQDPFGTGYQLTQSLMAYGRGGWLGEGLGNSIQKLKYLPEAHTDFICAIIGEELGFIGVCLLVCTLFWVAYRAIQLGQACLAQEKTFEGYTACGIGVWFLFQTVVNIGASMGLLPTKGLTLPLISYGGSSLIVMTVASMLLIRIGFELNTSQNKKL